MAGRIIAALMQFGVVWLFSTRRLGGVVAFVVVTCLLQASIILLFDKETKMVSLEELGDDLPNSDMSAVSMGD